MKKLERLVLCALLALVFFVRVYAFQTSIQFDSDFGRDSLFAVRILTEKPTLLGAQASVGGFYLGPLYFYFIAALFTVFGPLPEMISIAFVLMNVLAAWLIYRLVKKEVGGIPAVLGVVLFAVQPLLVSASRGATHQPMLPLITMVVVTCLLNALRHPSMKKFLYTGLAFGLFLHVHFSAFLMLPGMFLSVVVLTSETIKKKFFYCLCVIGGMLIMASPLIVFDVRHHFLTSQAFFQYLLVSVKGGAIAVNLPHWSVSQKMTMIASFVSSGAVLKVIGWLLAITGTFTAVRQKKKMSPLFPLLTLLTLTMIGMILIYPGYLFSYYMIVPCTVMLLWFVLAVWQYHTIWISLALICALVLVWSRQLPALYTKQYRTTVNLSQVTHIIERDLDTTGHPKFEIFKDSPDGMTGLGYEYRFLLQRDGYIPMSEYAYQDADVLYVIRENTTNDPLTLGNWEVKQFGGKKSERVGGVLIMGMNVGVLRLRK